jgi:hypothetical protein
MANERVARKQQVLYINTGTPSAPVWKDLGIRTPSSTTDVTTDTSTETDIRGNTWTDVNSMQLAQTFDPSPAIQGDAWQEDLVRKVMLNDIVGMSGQDVLWVMGWNSAMTAPFDAYRFPVSTIEVTSIGGDSYVDLAFTVNFGGEVEEGTVDQLAAGLVFTKTP